MSMIGSAKRYLQGAEGPSICFQSTSGSAGVFRWANNALDTGEYSGRFIVMPSFRVDVVLARVAGGTSSRRGAFQDSQSADFFTLISPSLFSWLVLCWLSLRASDSLNSRCLACNSSRRLKSSSKTAHREFSAGSREKADGRPMIPCKRDPIWASAKSRNLINGLVGLGGGEGTVWSLSRSPEDDEAMSHSCLADAGYRVRLKLCGLVSL